jgi:serine/threonine protein kinase
MSELKQGTIIKLTNGGQVKVQKELGRGGQGIVYLCEFKGQQYALKWYIQKYDDAFYNNLRTNITNDRLSKSKKFLWPLMLTEKQHNSFGYVMKRRPQEFKEMGQFLLAKAKFSSVGSMLNTAFQICEGFNMLHREGLSYQDINDGNFFIDPATGDVLICDNDNVTAQGQNLGIAGKMRYMAPEIVLGSKPDRYSDYFSLSMVLFLIFFNNHPLEGQRTLVPCMTEDYEKKFFGTEPVFIYDKNDKSNLPVTGIHTNVIKRWPAYPDLLKNTFMEALSQECMKTPTKRPIMSKWEKVLTEMRNNLMLDANGNDYFINSGEQPPFAIQTDSDGTIALSPKKTVFIGKSLTPVAQVRINKADTSVWDLQNLTAEKWMVETPTGKLKEVGPNEIMPTKPGLKITFPNKVKGTVI